MRPLAFFVERIWVKQMSLRAKIIFGFILFLMVGLFTLLFIGLGGKLNGVVIPRSAL